MVVVLLIVKTRYLNSHQIDRVSKRQNSSTIWADAKKSSIAPKQDNHIYNPLEVSSIYVVIFSDIYE